MSASNRDRLNSDQTEDQIRLNESISAVLSRGRGTQYQVDRCGHLFPILRFNFQLPTPGMRQVIELRPPIVV
jgi:hypothetical protein